MKEKHLKAEGFVFGKFYPLHLGHMAMIRFAAAQVKKLFVVVCCSDKEMIPVAMRLKWLQDELSDNQNIVIVGYEYEESELPNTSVSDVRVSAIWADVFKKLMPNVELLVTSEDYGQYVADAMGITHLPFDPDRNQFPVSASLLREDIINNWHFLPVSVQSSLQKVIVISGTESTGKTTLAKHLAEEFPSALVEEVGRKLIPDSNNFAMDDLYKVAHAHAESIANAKQKNKPFVVVDTDIYITQSYAEFVFNQQMNLQSEIYHLNNADLRLYLDATAPYVQDGTRMDEESRNQLDQSHRFMLDKHAQSYCEITSANWNSRTGQAMEMVEKLFVINWHK